MNKRRLLHPYNIALAVIMLAFAVWEIVAAVFDSGDLENMVTLSEYVWVFLDHVGWPAYVVVGAFLAWLVQHFLIWRK